MKAEDFYKIYKRGKRMENEYFIALDKETLFQMMEAFAEMKNRSKETESFQQPLNVDKEKHLTF